MKTIKFVKITIAGKIRYMVINFIFHTGVVLFLSPFNFVPRPLLQLYGYKFVLRHPSRAV